MNENEMKTLREHLTAAWRRLRDQAAAIELTYETVFGERLTPAATDDEPAARAPRKVSKRYRMTPAGVAAWMESRAGKRTTIGQLARHFGGSDAAAGNHLAALTRAGKCERVARGVYVWIGGGK